MLKMPASTFTGLKQIHCVWKFGNTTLFLRLGLPSTLIRHQNVAFQKRSLKRRNLKTPPLGFSVKGKRFENRSFWKTMT